jgi:hypothetical protein
MTANAGTNSLTCLPKHWGARDNKFWSPIRWLTFAKPRRAHWSRTYRAHELTHTVWGIKFCVLLSLLRHSTRHITIKEERTFSPRVLFFYYVPTHTRLLIKFQILHPPFKIKHSSVLAHCIQPCIAHILDKLKCTPRCMIKLVLCSRASNEVNWSTIWFSVFWISITCSHTSWMGDQRFVTGLLINYKLNIVKALWKVSAVV